MEVTGTSETVSTDAVLGTNAIPGGTAAGVHGVSKNAGPGVLGESVEGRGVQGISTNNYGVRAHSVNRAGLWATSAEGRGVEANSTNSEGLAAGSVKGNAIWGKTSTGAGVFAESESGVGVDGRSQTGPGVQGFSDTGRGMFGHSNTQAGVVGESQKSDGVFGISHDPTKAGISGHNWDQHGNQNPNGLAGWFGGKVVVTGDVEVSGDIKLTGGSDIAERFSVADAKTILPGWVMTFTEDGSIQPCKQSYDKKAAGVVSGAGDYKPGLLLGNDSADANKMPIALMGKVFCCVDAGFGSIAVGDLLTTSSTSGHAMKATDANKAFGAVIGKALKSLKEGKGLIPILVALQ